MSSMSTHIEDNDQSAGGLGTILRMSFGLLIICGLIYPLIMTGIAQAVMPKQADGSMIYDAAGNAIGSELIGQSFTEPQYFHGRISSIDYNANGAGSPNYAPSNPALKERLQQSIQEWQQMNSASQVTVPPADLLTNSASGLDPHITPAAANAQIPRIAQASGLTEQQLLALVEKHTQSPELGLFGESRVNVLLLNLDVQQAMNKNR